MYVERAFPEGPRLAEEVTRTYINNVVQELQEWQWIDDVEVVHPTWTDMAYTWAWPNSNWRKRAIQTLETYEIYQAGRYGRWVFQGIADSVREGLLIGAALRK